MFNMNPTNFAPLDPVDRQFSPSGDCLEFGHDCSEHPMPDMRPALIVPKCDGEAGCDKPVTHLDTAGFGYCTDHGIWRRQYEPCRKLTPAELNRLARGQQIEKY